MTMTYALEHMWTPLAATPLVWLTVTLLAYRGATLLQRACKGSLLASPVLIAIVVVSLVVVATRTSYAARPRRWRRRLGDRCSAGREP